MKFSVILCIILFHAWIIVTINSSFEIDDFPKKNVLKFFINSEWYIEIRGMCKPH